MRTERTQALSATETQKEVNIQTIMRPFRQYEQGILSWANTYGITCIPQIFSFPDDHQYVQMERIYPVDNSNGFNPTYTPWVAIHCFLGLSELHQHFIVHGDPTIQNMGLGHDGRFVFIDFNSSYLTNYAGQIISRNPALKEDVMHVHSMDPAAAGCRDAVEPGLILPRDVYGATMAWGEQLLGYFRGQVLSQQELDHAFNRKEGVLDNLSQLQQFTFSAIYNEIVGFELIPESLLSILEAGTAPLRSQRPSSLQMAHALVEYFKSE